MYERKKEIAEMAVEMEIHKDCYSNLIRSLTFPVFRVG